VKTAKKILSIAALCVAGFLFLRVHSGARSAGIFEPSGQAADSAYTGAAQQASVPIRAPVALIQSGEETPVPWTRRTPAAKRVRRIFPDPAWMTPDPSLKVGDLIRLELFEDAVFEAEIRNVTRYVNGAVGMTAHLRDGEEGVVYLSYSEGIMSLSVEVMNGRNYAVQYSSDESAYYSIEVDLEGSDILPGAGPAVREALADPAEDPDTIVVSEGTISVPAGTSVIDVMIVYTPAAKQWASARGGGIGNVIAGAMERANEAHTNSDTRVYLNLVHSDEIAYSESGSDIDQDLNRLTNKNDGYLDPVHGLRDLYQADLVCLFSSNSVAGGISWLLKNTNGSPSTAFSVVRVQQASWTYTLVHEWGHNMGAHHHKEQKKEYQPGPTVWENWPQNTWSAGWRWTGTNNLKYCSVMTYSNGQYFADGISHIQQPYFSNPQIFHQGVPTGHAADGDNARTIREMRTVLANYREAPDLDYDGIPNWWEELYYGGKTNAVATNLAANAHNTILEAYIAGLNPTHSSSFFRVNSFEPEDADGFVMRWNATSGRVYSVHWSTNLLNGFQPLQTNIFWPQASYTDTVHGVHSKGFYKIGVRMAE